MGSAPDRTGQEKGEELMHPDLQVQEYALLIDSISWELDLLKQAGWNGSVRYQRLTDIQERIQTFLDQAPPF